MPIAVGRIRSGSVVIAAALLVWLLVRGSSSTTTQSLQYPPWFGDPNRPEATIAGKVFGASGPMTVHLLLDVPDPMLWKWRKVRTSPTGEFDFGPMRAGRYRLFADGNGWLSRVISVDTIREAGDRTELFAHDLESLLKLDRDRDGMLDDWDWDVAYRLSTKPVGVFPGFGVPVSGAVVRADGSVAADVGVQPIECAGNHSVPQGMDIVATTSPAGGFAFMPYDFLCGLRVLMGPTVHEVQLDYNDRQLLLIQLPAPGREQSGIFDGRRHVDDPRGAWLRGHVLRDGRPAADINIGASVLPLDYGVSDGIRSRSDGSFELFISSKRLEANPFVLLTGWSTLGRLAGWQVVRLAPGQTRSDIKLQVGRGMTVSGTVLDERGLPVSGVEVGVWSRDGQSRSLPTAFDGYFELSIQRPGRYRLRAFVSESRERVPAMGSVDPQIDVSAPSGEMTGLQLVVGQRERDVSDDPVWGGIVELGADIDHNNMVTAVRDELAAAGLRVGDEVISATHSNVQLEPFWRLRRAERARWGEEVTLTIMRGNDRLSVRARAPYFGSPH